METMRYCRWHDTEHPVSDFRVDKRTGKPMARCRAAESEARQQRRANLDADQLEELRAKQRTKNKKYRQENPEREKARRDRRQVLDWVEEYAEGRVELPELERRYKAFENYTLEDERRRTRWRTRIKELPVLIAQKVGEARAEALLAEATADQAALEEALRRLRERGAAGRAGAEERAAERAAKRLALPANMSEREKDIRLAWPDGFTLLDPPVPLPETPYDLDDPAWFRFESLLGALAASQRIERRAHLKAAERGRKQPTAAEQDQVEAGGQIEHPDSWGSGF